MGLKCDFRPLLIVGLDDDYLKILKYISIIFSEIAVSTTYYEHVFAFSAYLADEAEACNNSKN